MNLQKKTGLTLTGLSLSGVLQKEDYQNLMEYQKVYSQFIY